MQSFHVTSTLHRDVCENDSDNDDVGVLYTQLILVPTIQNYCVPTSGYSFSHLRAFVIRCIGNV